MKLGISYKTVSEVRNFTTQDVKLNPKVYITDVGKEGEFIYDSSDTSSSDNLGTILVAGTARYKRVFEKEVNIRWFGANGDNTADDTTPLSNAVTYCIDNSYVCVFNTGEYKVTGNLYHNLSVNGNKNVYIKFVGNVKITVPSGNAIVDLHMINFSHNNNINAHITGDNCTVELNNKFKGFLRVGNYGFSGETPYVTDGGYCKIDLNNLTILNTYVENVVNTEGDNAASALFVNGTFNSIDIKNVYVNSVTRSGGLSGQSWWGDCKGILVNNTRATVVIKDCTVKNVLSHANFDANADGIAVFGLGSPTVNLSRTGKAFIENCILLECQTRGIKIQTSDATVSNCRFERNTVVSSPNSRDIDFQYGNGKAFNNTIIFKKNGATSPLDTYHASIRWCAILEDEEMYGIAENNTFYTDVVIPYPFFINYRDGLSIAVERSTYDVINNHIINTDDFTTTGCIGKSFVEFDAYYLNLHETQARINIIDNSYFSSAQPLLGYNSAPADTNLGDKLVFTLENNRNTNLALVPLLFSYSSGGVDIIKVNRFKIFNNSGFSDRLSTVWIVDFNNLKIMPHSQFVVDLSTNTVANGRLLNAPAGIPTTDYAFVKVIGEWLGVTYIQIYVHGSTRQYFYEWNGYNWKSHSVAVDSNIGQHPLTFTTSASTNVTLPNTGTLATLAGTESLTNKTVNGVVLSTGAGATNFLNGDGNYVAASGGGGGDALTTQPLSQFAATTSAQLAGVISDETGTGSLVFANSPTLVTPNLGTPSAINLTNATSIPASQLTGTIPSGVLGNSTVNIGTTAILLNRASGALALTGITSIDGFAAAVTLTADNTTNATNYPLFANAATGNLSPRTDTGFTYNPSTGVLTSTTFAGELSGNATTATTLQTGRTINGVSFNGSADITVTAAASTLTGTTLNATVTGSSLTSVGTITSGTWSGSFGAVSGANLTNLTAANLTGTIPSAVLGNSSHFIGTTSIALNRASANQALTGILSVQLAGATSGTTTIQPTAVAGTTTITFPAVTGTVITTGDSGTVTNTMLAGSIANAKLANSTISGVSLGGNLATLTISTGLTGTSYNGSGAVSIAIDSTVVTLSGSQTLTNKRITARVQSTTSTATFTFNFDNDDVGIITAQAAGLTVTTSGTPTSMQPFVLCVKDNGTARAITWNGIFVAIGVTLPTTTVVNKHTYVSGYYNTTAAKVHIVGVTTEA